MWTSNKLTDLLKVKYPILQAPMAIVTTPALAAAVAEQGGLGALGCAVLSASEIRDQVGDFRRRTGNRYPIHLNFFVHQRPKRDPEVDAEAQRLVAPFYREFGLLQDVPTPSEPFLPLDPERLDAVLAIKAEIVSFHFGLPSQGDVQALKGAGIRVMSSATTVEEAVELERQGVDAIIAQGFEAGGHRGHFLGDGRTGQIGTMALVPQVVDAVGVPVIAAGAITDSRGIKAAFALGASGVQMGTAFLRCPESHVTEPHRRALAESSSDDTRLTRAFSGRPARSLRNRYLDTLAPFDAALPDFPLMNPLSKPLRAASDRANVPDCLPLWSGQSFRLARAVPAAEVMKGLIKEVEGSA